MAYDHLIYLAGGNNVQIYGNWLWNDPHGRGVQLYPAPTNAKVYDNVVDRAGEGFVIGNEPGYTVSGNQIYHNIITNCTGLPWQGIPGQAIHDLYGGPRAPATLLQQPHLQQPRRGRTAERGQAYGNVTGNPQFVNSPAHNFAVATSSPAAAWHLWNGLS